MLKARAPPPTPPPPSSYAYAFLSAGEPIYTVPTPTAAVGLDRLFCHRGRHWTQVGQRGGGLWTLEGGGGLQ